MALNSGRFSSKNQPNKTSGRRRVAENLLFSSLKEYGAEALEVMRKCYKEAEKEKNLELINLVVSEKINQIEADVRLENELRRKSEDLLKQRHEEKERLIRERELVEKQASEYKQQHHDKITDFIAKFIDSYERNPQTYEIIAALQVDIDIEVLDDFLKTYDYKIYKPGISINIV
jgi:hypothetical protein